jgi:ABC-type transporter Mla MlaB component
VTLDGTPRPRGGGVVRLLTTSAGRALCLAGEVDEALVEGHLRRYGREPMPVDVIDAGSVTRLSMPALDLLLEHLRAAEQAGRTVRVRRSPSVERLLAGTAPRGV